MARDDTKYLCRYRWYEISECQKMFGSFNGLFQITVKFNYMIDSITIFL